MRVLMISGDKNVLQPQSGVHQRLLLQAAQTEGLIVLAPAAKRAYIPLGEKGEVYGFVGSKPHIAFTMIEFVRRAVQSGEHFDVVTAQDPFFLGLVGLRAAKMLGAKLNIQVHADLSAQSFLKRSIAKFVLRRADSVRVVSERIKSQASAMSVRAPIRVLPVFVDIKKFSSVVPRQHTQPTIIWIGRFEEEKDPLAAIAVLEKVLNVEKNVQLVMLGDGSMAEKIRTRANGLPVTLPGWQDSLAYLDTADVVLCTSRTESWGASIVEALAAGVPVVAPDVGIAGEAGAFVVPKEKLAEEVIRVLQEGSRGKLNLHLLAQEEWLEAWKKSLV